MSRTHMLEIDVAYPAQIGPGVHGHQWVSDPSNYARQAGQTFRNPRFGEEPVTL